MYVGFGYDVHRFKEGKSLILGGVEISNSLGVDGHSDADVLTHALMDALLGALGLNDIGYFFPNDDQKYRNISSIFLLKIIYEKLKQRNFFINNVDTTIIAEIPRISPFIDDIKENISKTIKLKKERIGVKATTNEKMSFIGRREGIAVMAVASISPSSGVMKNVNK
jgi:2-C-methyl-D-erythritol 2,4-cyclodiphosphate synthase